MFLRDLVRHYWSTLDSEVQVCIRPNLGVRRMTNPPSTLRHPPPRSCCNLIALGHPFSTSNSHHDLAQNIPSRVSLPGQCDADRSRQNAHRRRYMRLLPLSKETTHMGAHTRKSNDGCSRLQRGHEGLPDESRSRLSSGEFFSPRSPVNFVPCGWCGRSSYQFCGKCGTHLLKSRFDPAGEKNWFNVGSHRGIWLYSS